MKLMLVEDEYLLNKTIKTYLESRGFKVDGFLDGQEAIDAISNEYDVFILDIDIPKISGIEILEYIRSIYAKVPIIIISATIDMQMITEAYTKGCDDYLKKPFDIKELELKICAFTREIRQDIELAQNLIYNKNTRCIKYNDEDIVLSMNEKIFISLLVENKGSFVSSETIERAIWDVNVAHLRQLVSRFRKKIPLDFIQNSVGEGYSIK